LDFHFNARLSTINISKVEALKKHNMKEDFIFLMASIKRIVYNVNFIKIIFSRLAFDLSLIKLQAVFKEFRNYGAIAA